MSFISEFTGETVLILFLFNISKGAVHLILTIYISNVLQGNHKNSPYSEPNGNIIINK